LQKKKTTEHQVSYWSQSPQSSRGKSPTTEAEERRRFGAGAGSSGTHPHKKGVSMGPNVAGDAQASR